jgi:hypothetical protein
VTGEVGNQFFPGLKRRAGIGIATEHIEKLLSPRLDGSFVACNTREVPLPGLFSLLVCLSHLAVEVVIDLLKLLFLICLDLLGLYLLKGKCLWPEAK